MTPVSLGQVRPAAVDARDVARAAHSLLAGRRLSQNLGRGLRLRRPAHQRLHAGREVHAHPHDGLRVIGSVRVFANSLKTRPRLETAARLSSTAFLSLSLGTHLSLSSRVRARERARSNTRDTRPRERVSADASPQMPKIDGKNSSARHPTARGPMWTVFSRRA